MNDSILAIVRVAVQTAIGAVATYAASRGLNIDSEAAFALIFPLVTVAYYALSRFLMARIPGLSFILGPGPSPTYSPPVDAAA